MQLDSGALLDRTCRDLTAQGVVPLSPGQVEHGTTLLCAGAALVKQATLMLRSPEAASLFEREVVRQGASYIREVGTTLGLDATTVNSVVIVNDKLPLDQRLLGTIAHLKCVAPNLHRPIDRNASLPEPSTDGSPQLAAH